MKTITMPYDEYQNDIHNARNEMYTKFIQPIVALVKVEISSARTIDNIPHARWLFEGSVDELLERLCKIIDTPSLSETRQALREKYE